MRRSNEKMFKLMLFTASFLTLLSFISLSSLRNSEFRSTWVDHLCQRRRHQLRRMGAQNHLQVSWKPPVEGTIFLTQTSCATELSSREACAVESAAHHHPNRQVALYMTAPYVNNTHPLIRVLLGLENVEVRWLDLDQVFVEDPLQAWHQERHWFFNQEFAPTIVSDAVRAEILRRWGGVYLDLDVLTLSPLPSESDWIGRLDENQVNGAVANFTKNHKLFEMVVQSIPTSFDPKDCCSIGPSLITWCLHLLCPANVTIPDPSGPDTIESCDQVTIYNTRAFYPFSYVKKDILRMFETRKGFGKEFVDSTRAYTLHLFHSLTKGGRVAIDGGSVLEEVAKRNCPRVYEAVVTNNLLL